MPAMFSQEEPGMERGVASTETQSSNGQSRARSEGTHAEGISPSNGAIVIMRSDIAEPEAQATADVYNQMQLGQLPVSSRDTSHKQST